MEKNEKNIVAECEKDPGHRCTVASYYGGLEFYLLKQLEIRDVRLVHAPPAGVGKFGGDTDNWMWPRHTGDYGFYRAYVSKDGKAADFSKDNVPYVPKHFLKIAKEGVKEGDFIMALGYPGRTNRHRLPSEVASTFDWNYPSFIKSSAETLAIIDRETKNDPAAKLKYAGQVANVNNYYKNRKGMLTSYEGSDFLARKTKEHAELKAWVNANPARQKEYAADIEQSRAADRRTRRDDQARLLPGVVVAAPAVIGAFDVPPGERKRQAGRRAQVGLPGTRPAALPVQRHRLDRTYDAKVDKALVMNSLTKYAAQPAASRNANFDAAMGIKDGMSAADLSALLDRMYAATTLGDAAQRSAWLKKSPAEFKASNDRFIKAAVAMYDGGLKREAEDEELGGKIQQAYANYMKAKIAYMNSKGQAVYPDANSTLRVTFGKIAGRDHGADGTGAWTAFTTVKGVVAKATGEGEFNAPANAAGGDGSWPRSRPRTSASMSIRS